MKMTTHLPTTKSGSKSKLVERRLGTRGLDGRMHAPISSMEAAPILSMETGMISLWFDRDAVVSSMEVSLVEATPV